MSLMSCLNYSINIFHEFDDYIYNIQNQYKILHNVYGTDTIINTHEIVLN